MPKWTDYTKKTSPENNDEVMILDTAGKANKRLGLSVLSDWIIRKIANKVFENLQTQNKTILGALNELNGNSFKVIITSASDIIENVIDAQKTDSIMLIYGTTGTGKKQNLPAGGCVWLGIAVSSTDHIFSSLYLLGNNHIYARTKANGTWGDYVTIA